MPDRRRCLSSLAGLVLGLGAARAAERPPSRPFRIGFLTWGSSLEVLHAPPFPAEFMVGLVGKFVTALRELGYVDGVDFVFEFRSAAGVVDRLPKLAAELVQWRADVIVCGTAAPTLAVLRATATIPIVFVAVPDPIAAGLVTSLAHPGGNVTGLAGTAGDSVGRMLQTLKEAVPGLARVGLMLSTADPIRDTVFAQVAAMGMIPVAGEDIARPEDIAPAFAAMVRQKVQGVVVLLGAIGFTRRAQISELALTQRLPAIASMSEFADAGLLMTFGSDLSELHVRAATYVDKILRGARPADLPVELPTRFSVIINLKTASELGLAIAPALRLRADRVIE